MTQRRLYDSNLAMGLGLLNETKTLLSQWEPSMDAHGLYAAALSSGLLSEVSASRLKNIVIRCFANRYLIDGGKPAGFLKHLSKRLSPPVLTQLFFLYTCRANPILYDFIREVYWDRYASGAKLIPKEVSEDFIRKAIDDGKTPSRWADGQIERVGRYLSGCCADFGLMGGPAKDGRAIRQFRVEQATSFFLAHELHFDGVGDNALLTHEDWQLFGLAREDVLEEIKRLSMKGLLIVQAAGDVIRIGWKQQDMEALCDVLAQG
jgi:hypothetical protein